jgi:hypothetical protein
VLQVTALLRTPTAGADDAVADNVWDLAAKWTVEGQPHDAAKLLQVLAALRREPGLQAYAELLDAFPAFGAKATEAVAAYGSAWDAWHARAASARRGGLGGVYSAVADALLDVLVGDVWQGLQRLHPVGALMQGLLGATENGEGSFSYATWYHVCLGSVLYGRPASTMQRAHVADVVLQSMRVAGETVADVDGEEYRAAQANNGGPDAAAINGCLVAVFDGNAATGLRLLLELKQTWAAAAVGDLLWHAGVSHVRSHAG